MLPNALERRNTERMLSVASCCPVLPRPLSVAIWWLAMRMMSPKKKVHGQKFVSSLYDIRSVTEFASAAKVRLPCVLPLL